MVRRNCSKFVVAAGIVCLLLSAESALADPLKNGDFESGLSEWTVAPDGSVVPDSGAALFLPDNPDNTSPYSNSTLFQEFTLDHQSLILSFEMDMYTSGTGETDTFTATLLDLDNMGNPIGSVSSGSHFYSLNSSGDEDKATGVSVIGNTVSLCVSSWANSNVKLVFNLQHDYSDDLWTTVLLDNVALVPVPGAVLLGSIGLAYSGLRLRRRKEL